MRQSMGRVGSCFDNAAAEAFFSTLEHEVLSRRHFTTRAEAREVLVAWYLEFYNVRQRHSSAGLQPPADDEKTAADQPVAAKGLRKTCPSWGSTDHRGTSLATASRRRVRGLGTQRSAR